MEEDQKMRDGALKGWLSVALAYVRGIVVISEEEAIANNEERDLLIDAFLIYKARQQGMVTVFEEIKLLENDCR